MNKIFCFLSAIIFLAPTCVLAQGMGAAAAEALLFQEIPGVITKIEQREAPVSVTTITAEDIKLTPARNLLDIIEAYVPGALYMHHSEGNQPGIRGIISDRRNKFILLVNGKSMAVKGHNGVETEIDDWDLGDIEKIEVIRGPGSVTYGPGAIMGVINIITKSEITSPGFTFGQYYTSNYNSLGTRMSYGIDKEDYGMYVYASITDTKGIKHPRTYAVIPNSTSAPPNTAGSHGYWGDGLIGDTPNYLKDSNDKPHLKLFGNLNFFKEWRFWVRFLRDGIPTTGFGTIRQTLDGAPTDREAKQNRQITFVLENEHVFNKNKDFSLKSMISYMSTDTQSFYANTYSADRANGSNYNWNYAEDQFFLKSTLNIKFNEMYSGAIGFAYDHSMWGPGWGDDSKDFRMGDRKNIVNGPDSNAIAAILAAGDTPVYAGSSGWNTDTKSLFGEIDMNFHPKLNILSSFRLDKDDFSKLLFSPRVAIFSDWQKFGITKLILQKSLRMSTAEQLFEQNLSGAKPNHEEFQGIEFIYNPLALGNFTPSVSMFYNELEVLGWNKTASSTVLTGEGSLHGMEVEGKYAKDNVTFGINHSYCDLDSWSLGNSSDSGGFSYKDTRLVKSGIRMSGSGNNINNWSKNTTKMFYNLKLLGNKLTLHTNVQIYWGIEGIKDQLDVVENATKGTDYENVNREIRDQVESRNAGDLDLRLNVSASYALKESLTATLHIMNLLTTNSKRYYYDSGSLTAPYPTRISWIEEPLTIGVSFDYKF